MVMYIIKALLFLSAGFQRMYCDTDLRKSVSFISLLLLFQIVTLRVLSACVLWTVVCVSLLAVVGINTDLCLPLTYYEYPHACQYRLCHSVLVLWLFFRNVFLCD